MIGASVYAQSEFESFKKFEIKTNVFYDVLGAADLTLEAFTSENFSLGISGHYTYSNRWESEPRFLFFFARQYIGSRQSKGLYLEPFFTVNWEDSQSGKMSSGAGLAAGHKWFIGKKFLLETFIGIGENFLSDPDNSGTVGRIGVNFGIRL